MVAKIGLRVFFSIVVCCSIGVSLLGGCTSSKGANFEKPNIVLIVIDTLRADMLPFNGGKREIAPFLTHLGENGVAFNNAISTSSWTAPATASILSGLYPLEHGILMGRRATRALSKKDPAVLLNALPQSVVTIAEVMKANGFKTFAAVDNGNIRADSGFNQGFDHFASFQNEGGENINKTLLGWSKDIKSGEPYFLYLQYMDPHHSYIEHEPWFQGEHIKDVMQRSRYAYQSEVSYVDLKIKEMFEHFGWDKNTIVLVTSDHGEEFNDHGSFGHGKTLYGEVVRVPFIVYYPDGKIKSPVISNYISSLDATPTILDMADLKYDHRMSGQSLVPLISGERGNNPRSILAHLWKIQRAGGTVEITSLFEGDFRVILSSKRGEPELFNVNEDPRELNNLASKFPDKVAALSAAIEEFEKALKPHERAWIPLPEGDEDNDE